MRWFYHMTIAATVSASVFVALATFAPAISSPTDAAAESQRRTAKAPAREVQIFADGVLEAARPEVNLRFEVPGRLRTVHVHAGAAVKAGDVLAELESDVNELQLEEAEARLKIAKAERDRLFADLEGRGQPPRFDTTIAETQVTLAETALRREQLLLEKLRLRAPFDGVVLRAEVEPGEYTGPADARELFTIVEGVVRRVRAYVEELDGLRVVPGQRARVSVAASPGTTYQGTVAFCAPSFRPKAHQRLKPGERLDIRVREVLIDLTDGQELVVGLPVEVFIDAGEVKTSTTAD